MKTITEFAAITLKNAAKTKQELTTAGKTAEELPAAMGEALKLEGDKLIFLLGALEAVGEKTNELKRVVVLALNEGEKAPTGVKQIGEKYFSIEFYQSMQKPRADEGRDGGRGDKRGGKRGDKRGAGGGGRGDGKRGEGRPGGDRGGAPGERGASAGPGGDRGPGGAPGGRGPRAPRPQGAGGPPNIKPVIKPNVTPVAPKAAEAPKADDSKA
jgi:hypothetical protein